MATTLTLIDLVPALAAMLGANVGATLIVQVLSFDVSRVASLGVSAGIMMSGRGEETRTRDFDRVLIGLGLMLLALRQLLELLADPSLVLWPPGGKVWVGGVCWTGGRRA